MTWIPKHREEALERAGVHIVFVDREQGKAWKESNPGVLEHLFSGWYYHQGARDPARWEGPFRSWSGAAQHAYIHLRVAEHPRNNRVIYLAAVDGRTRRRA